MKKGSQKGLEKGWKKGAPAGGFTVAILAPFLAPFFSVSRRIVARTPFLLVFYPFVFLIEKGGKNRAKNEENGKKGEKG
jgi:hypothetical protein